MAFDYITTAQREFQKAVNYLGELCSKVSSELVKKCPELAKLNKRVAFVALGVITSIIYAPISTTLGAGVGFAASDKVQKNYFIFKGNFHSSPRELKILTIAAGLFILSAHGMTLAPIMLGMAGGMLLSEYKGAGAAQEVETL